MEADHDELETDALSRHPGMVRSCLKPAVQPGADHLDLQREALPWKPDTTFESDHVMRADELRQELLKRGAIKGSIQPDLTADGLHMAVIVMIMVVIVVMMPSFVSVLSSMARFRGLQPEHQSWINLPSADRQCARTGTQPRLDCLQNGLQLRRL